MPPTPSRPARTDAEEGSRRNSSHKSLGQRLALLVVPPLAALVIALVGSTLRFEDLVEVGARVEHPPIEGIFCFWHQCAFLAAWRFRRFHPYVLISQSFDGELVARTLRLLGYRTVRGSSSRGGLAGLLRLRALVDAGEPAIFTADGPRGPVYQAKSGPVKLAQLTGRSIGAFHLQPARASVLPSWDRFVIPWPFTRVVVAWSRTVPPPLAQATPEDFAATRQELDAALERARKDARARLSRR